MSDSPRTTYNIEVSERHLQFENTALKNQIEMLKDENAALKKENAALKKEAVIAEKYGLSQAAEICRDAALSFPISAYWRGFDAACRDNYNAILEVKDKP